MSLAPVKTEPHVDYTPQFKRGRKTQNKEKMSSQLTNRKVVLEDTGDSKGLKRKRSMNHDLYDDKVACAVIKRAEEVQANLAPEFPSMIKYMLKSHVTGGFWLGLPRKFCINHLPKQDTTIILEDESGKEYKTVYLAAKTGLSGGWRGFSIAHNLLEGDVLVFHLVRPSKFKVYIVRRNGSDEVDGALGLLKLDACFQQMECERDLAITTKVEIKCMETFIPDIPLENIQKDCLTFCGNNLTLKSDHSENESDDSEVLDGIRLSETVIEFKEVKRIEDFTILANGLVINSELSKHLQIKYYELCSSQKSFLHDRLLGGLNCRLVAGIIAETINIADAIRASKMTTSQDDFKIWEKTLKAFEDLGMNVGFLRARLDQLVNLLSISKRIQEAKMERTHAEEERHTLEANLLEVKQRINMLDSEIQTLEAKGDQPEFVFKESARASW